MIFAISLFVAASALLLRELSARGKAVYGLLSAVFFGAGMYLSYSLMGYDFEHNWFPMIASEVVAIVLAGAISMGFFPSLGDGMFVSNGDIDDLKGDDGKLY